MCIYLVMNQKVFHVSISLGVRMFDHQLTPAMSDLEAKTEEKIQQLLMETETQNHRLIVLALSLI